MLLLLDVLSELCDRLT